MVLSTLLCLALVAQIPGGSDALSGTQPIRFIQNLGQTDEAVRFTASNGALDAYLTDDALVLRLDGAGTGNGADDEELSAVVLRLRFEGALEDARVRGEGRTDGVVHSYRGTDAGRWVAGAPVFSSVRWTGVAQGVDVRLLERDGRLAYDLLLEPGADLSSIVLACEGADRLELVAPDRLLVHTALGPLEQSLPAAWELDDDGRQIPVDAAFRLVDDTHFGFEVENRCAERALVIDPGLNYGTYLGGSLLDTPYGVGFGPGGDLIVVGSTGSQNFPTTPGAEQGARAGNSDAFIARLDASTGALVYATFFGGTDNSTFDPEGARDVAVAADGSVTAVGRADSVGFPTTLGTVGAVNAGGINGFVARFDPSGALVWSTLVGGSKQDTVTAVALDATGRSTITGITFSDDFPVTPGAYDETFNSIFFTNDIFVARLAADATSYDYATYIGGSLRDEGLDVAVAADDSAVVTGLTGSSDFPTSTGAYDEGFNGAIPNDTDAFVLRMSPSGDALTWSTFLGSSALVEGRGIALDASGNAVVTGLTVGDDFPTTAGAFQEDFAGGASDAFVSKLSEDGSSLLWSTFLGGSGDDDASAVALTGGGLPTVTGTTTSIDFPTRGAAPVRTAGVPGTGFETSRGVQGGGSPGGAGPGPYSPSVGSVSPAHDDTLDGGQDAFLVRLTSGAKVLRYGSLYGGSDIDSGVAVDVDEFGAAVVAGGTRSTDLELAGATWDATHNGIIDTFLTRWSLPPFENLGLGTAGADGDAPDLVPHGSLEPGAPFSVQLSGAPAGATTLLFVSRTAATVPFLGGVLVAWPAEVVLPLRTDASGELSLEVARWPTDLPSGAQLVLQAWSADTGMPGGAVSSNALALLAP